MAEIGVCILEGNPEVKGTVTFEPVVSLLANLVRVSTVAEAQQFYPACCLSSLPCKNHSNLIWEMFPCLLVFLFH